jgi:hypothetical protein
MAEWSDVELVAHFRRWAIERSKFRALHKGNSIYDREIAPAYTVLAARGSASLRALLSLVDDPNLSVELDAAILVYDLDPQQCREALRRVMKEEWLRPTAVVLLLQKDPAFADAFSRLARERDPEAVDQMIDAFANDH